MIANLTTPDTLSAREIQAGDAHVWSMKLEPEPTRLDELFALLNAEEQARAKRFRFDRDRVRFVASHGQLREVLGRYVGTEPERLEFRIGKFGKPSLVNSKLGFSLSHSRNVGLCAVAGRGPVGIDLEFVRDELSGIDLAEGFFTAKETERLQAMDLANQREGFFRIWTAKEAFLKATGEGLSREADSFELTFDVDGSPCGIRGDHAWSIQELEVPTGFKAALATFGNPPRVSAFTV